MRGWWRGQKLPQSARVSAHTSVRLARPSTSPGLENHSSRAPRKVCSYSYINQFSTQQREKLRSFIVQKKYRFLRKLWVSTHPLLVFLERLPPKALHAGAEALLHQAVVHPQAAQNWAQKAKSQYSELRAWSDGNREPEAGWRWRWVTGLDPESIARSPLSPASLRAAQTSLTSVAVLTVPPPFSRPWRYFAS